MMWMRAIEWRWHLAMFYVCLVQFSNEYMTVTFMLGCVAFLLALHISKFISIIFWTLLFFARRKNVHNELFIRLASILLVSAFSFFASLKKHTQAYLGDRIRQKHQIHKVSMRHSDVFFPPFGQVDKKLCNINFIVILCMCANLHLIATPTPTKNGCEPKFQYKDMEILWRKKAPTSRIASLASNQQQEKNEKQKIWKNMFGNCVSNPKPAQNVKKNRSCTMHVVFCGAVFCDDGDDSSWWFEFMCLWISEKYAFCSYLKPVLLVFCSEFG